MSHNVTKDNSVFTLSGQVLQVAVIGAKNELCKLVDTELFTQIPNTPLELQDLHDISISLGIKLGAVRVIRSQLNKLVAVVVRLPGNYYRDGGMLSGASNQLAD